MRTLHALVLALDLVLAAVHPIAGGIASAVPFPMLIEASAGLFAEVGTVEVGQTAGTKTGDAKSLSNTCCRTVGKVAAGSPTRPRLWRHQQACSAVKPWLRVPRRSHGSPMPFSRVPCRRGRGMEEQTIFADKRVTITTTRAVLGGTTYAMANITSVRTHDQPRSLALIAIGFLGVALGVSCIAINGLDGPVFGIGLISTLMGAAMFGGYFLEKPKHWVRIGTAGAESNAVCSDDPAWTARVVAAMNEAIVRRG